jgi:hypothetical protein
MKTSSLFLSTAIMAFVACAGLADQPGSDNPSWIGTIESIGLSGSFAIKGESETFYLLGSVFVDSFLRDANSAREHAFVGQEVSCQSVNAPFDTRSGVTVSCNFSTGLDARGNIVTSLQDNGNAKFACEIYREAGFHFLDCEKPNR